MLLIKGSRALHRNAERIRIAAVLIPFPYVDIAKDRRDCQLHCSPGAFNSMPGNALLDYFPAPGERQSKIVKITMELHR